MSSYYVFPSRKKIQIITGCTISAILLNLDMNLIVKSAEKECRGPVSFIWHPTTAVRAYVDNLTVCDNNNWRKMAIEWVGKIIQVGQNMEIKPEKSRSLVIKKGKLDKY